MLDFRCRSIAAAEMAELMLRNASRSSPIRLDANCQASTACSTAEVRLRMPQTHGSNRRQVELADGVSRLRLYECPCGSHLETHEACLPRPARKVRDQVESGISPQSLHPLKNGVRLNASPSKERARDRRHLRGGAVVETGQPLGGYQRGPGRACRRRPAVLGRAGVSVKNAACPALSHRRPRGAEVIRRNGIR